MKALPLGRARTVAIANILSLAVGIAIHADEIEVPNRVLLAERFTAPSTSEDRAPDRFATSFGIRKSRGVQFIRPIEVNDQEYELNLSGPIVKSGTKKKFFGLNLELRF